MICLLIYDIADDALRAKVGALEGKALGKMGN